MSFLVIYVSNSESTSTSYSSQRHFIFVGTFQGQRIQFQNFTEEKKKKWNFHYTILATRKAAPIAPLSNFVLSLAQSMAQVKHNSTDFLPSLPQHSWWMLFCWCSMVSSTGHPEPLPSEINSCYNKESIMRLKNSGLVFPSGKLMGGFKFTEMFEMEGRRENNW